jgi:hypothetical protein
MGNILKCMNTHHNLDSIELKHLISKNTTEKYAKIILNNFMDSKSVIINTYVNIIKVEIIKSLPELKNHIIKISPVHKSDNWSYIDDENTYIVVAIFHQFNKEYFNNVLYCLQRILLLIKENTISIVEKKNRSYFVDKKNVIHN